MGKRRIIEWNILIGAIIAMPIWLFVCFPIFNFLGAKSPALAYATFLLVSGIIGFVIGTYVHKGIEAFFVSVGLMMFTDILMPPMVISFDKAPSAEVLSIWGSDTAIYSIYYVLGLGHQATWVLTYLFTPLVGLFLLLFFLSGKALKNKLIVILNGG
jgi:hypothetical protein